mmetsp:Transcript_56186/g.50543  ORF Transcript_56186/g.50543 Transcript_56186/m.50543 type:complete len:317 (-) Transcript_56186:630-1580(-)
MPFSRYFVMVLIMIFYVNGHNHPAYNHDENGLGWNADWQAKLHDNTKINHLSIPGTHDTMADDNDNDWVDCQDSTLTKQLEAGIRVLDIRCRAYNGVFPIHHGAFYLSVDYDDVLNECKEFLDAHPTEFIIMNVQQEYSTVSHQDFNDIFAKYFDDPTYSSYFYRTENYDNIPFVGDVRGKIYIFQNFVGSRKFGFKMGANDINNMYEIKSNWGLYDKWENVKAFLIQTNNDPKPSDKFKINYLSASGAKSLTGWPYFVASGHSSIGTGAPRLATGSTTCPTCDHNKWPDFPRTDCLGTWCTIAFEGTNILTYNLY